MTGRITGLLKLAKDKSTSSIDHTSCGQRLNSLAERNVAAKSTERRRFSSIVQGMESLLQRIVDTGSEIAIIDITGVPTVDTLVAQHLLKTVTAIRLMGADCIISGVRPQIAQTIVHLGVDLQGVTTKATLADALAHVLNHRGQRIGQQRPGQQRTEPQKPGPA